MLQRIIGEDIQLHLTVDLEPLLVQADAAQLEQVLMNLAVNARDAMPDGGSLSIVTAAVFLSAEDLLGKPGLKPGKFAQITFRDSGCGMTSDVLSHIFEPFFTTKDCDRGTGLGLATSYGIINQHGGFINVHSIPGTGTTFDLYLPSA